MWRDDYCSVQYTISLLEQTFSYLLYGILHVPIVSAIKLSACLP